MRATRHIAVAVLILALALPIPALTAVPVAAVPPTTRASATTQGAQAAGLPPEYSALQTRNPFAHAGKAGPVGPNPAGPGGPGGPEAQFVLRGIVQAGNDFTAFLEDTAAHRIVELAAGAPLGPGRIKRIDVDAIEYDAQGASRRIEVGQDLGGRVVPPIPTSKPAGPPPQPGQGPPGPPNGPMPGPGQRPPRGGGPPQGPQPVQEQPPQ